MSSIRQQLRMYAQGKGKKQISTLVGQKNVRAQESAHHTTSCADYDNLQGYELLREYFQA